MNQTILKIKNNMDEIERQSENEEKEKMEDEGGGVRYDDHIVESIPIKKVYPNIFTSPNDWVYDTNNCTEKIEQRKL